MSGLRTALAEHPLAVAAALIVAGLIVLLVALLVAVS